MSLFFFLCTLCTRYIFVRNFFYGAAVFAFGFFLSVCAWCGTIIIVQGSWYSVLDVGLMIVSLTWSRV